MAFFLLATVSFNGLNFRGQRYPTYYESRILPIKQTWGSFFPYFYFVFGNSVHDHRFILQRCKLLSTQGDPYVRHRTLRNSTDLYDCPVLKHEWTWNYTKAIETSNPSPAVQIFNEYQQRRLQPFKALYTTNCSGTYFGIGPTCRCQEAMRFFIQNTQFSHVKWFAFMDDDLYYRPYSLLSLLYKLQSTVARHDSPVTLVSGVGLRGFTQFKNKLTADGIHNCTNEQIHRFMYAQPAFINR
ncbi:hypothetical protein EON65_28675 [archaeon]|nr:MAG: hypothetical protein EON65_28675 [archaeon]